jgi:hypothetical protein
MTKSAKSPPSPSSGSSPAPSSTSGPVLEQIAGHKGEICYCLIADHHSRMLYGRCSATKDPPLGYLKSWLLYHHPATKDIPEKYVRLDQGTELGLSPAVNDLFTKFGYKVEHTAPASSVQNAPVERPHQTIGNGIRSLLHGAGLPAKFWPYAFHHFLRIYNVTPHVGHDKSPYEICSGVRPDLRKLRTFGCTVYILDKKKSPKPLIKSAPARFLGYTKTYRQVFYVKDIHHGNVLTASHVQFDEGMTDTEPSQ